MAQPLPELGQTAKKDLRPSDTPGSDPREPILPSVLQAAPRKAGEQGTRLAKVAPAQSYGQHHRDGLAAPLTLS